MISDAVRDAMLTAADAAGSSRINARQSWMVEQRTSDLPPVTVLRPGVLFAKLRCDPPPCVELWIVADDAITTDWEVG